MSRSTGYRDYGVTGIRHAGDTGIRYSGFTGTKSVPYICDREAVCQLRERATCRLDDGGAGGLWVSPRHAGNQRDLVFYQ